MLDIWIENNLIKKGYIFLCGVLVVFELGVV